jgi:hypothetical protein
LTRSTGLVLYHSGKMLRELPFWVALLTPRGAMLGIARRSDVC